ncbi:MAG TPA: DUF1360 domain-containing protein [Gaiellaceae bacterium]|nr:DUF1360 domain-containing protein [Gaiellaceae bacterium]
MADPGVGLRFALASLATWRVTHLLAEEDGPWDAMVRVRTHLGQGQLGALMDCFYCLSIWVAAPATLAVARRPRDAPIALLALSGAACLLEGVTGTTDDPVQEGVPDVLWPEAQVS